MNNRQHWIKVARYAWRHETPTRRGLNLLVSEWNRTVDAMAECFPYFEVAGFREDDSDEAWHIRVLGCLLLAAGMEAAPLPATPPEGGP